MDRGHRIDRGRCRSRCRPMPRKARQTICMQPSAGWMRQCPTFVRQSPSPCAWRWYWVSWIGGFNWRRVPVLSPIFQWGRSCGGKPDWVCVALKARPRWNVFLPITIRAFGTAWVLKNHVLPGTVLTEDDAIEAEVDWAEERTPVMANQSQWVGQVAARTLTGWPSSQGGHDPRSSGLSVRVPGEGRRARRGFSDHVGGAGHERRCSWAVCTGENGQWPSVVRRGGGQQNREVGYMNIPTRTENNAKVG